MNPKIIVPALCILLFVCSWPLLAEADNQQEVKVRIENRNVSRYSVELSRIGDGASILIAFAVAYSYRKIWKKKRIFFEKRKRML